MLCESLDYCNRAGSSRLNPCSNGRCSASLSEQVAALFNKVLILVLMEDALRENW